MGNRREDAQAACEAIGRLIVKALPERTSFALIVFTTPDEGEDEGSVSCVSDTEGAPLAHALRLCLAQILRTHSPNGGGHA